MIRRSTEYEDSGLVGLINSVAESLVERSKSRRYDDYIDFPLPRGMDDGLLCSFQYRFRTRLKCYNKTERVVTWLISDTPTVLSLASELSKTRPTYISAL